MKFKIFAIFLISTSCSLFKPDPYKDHPCVNDKNKSQTVEWGYYLSESKEFFGFKLNTLGEIYLSSNVNSEEQIIHKISFEEFCKINSELNKEIIKTQTLNVPRDTNAYIIIRNNEINYFFRAAWDPKFETYGSAGFREIWKELNLKISGDTVKNKINYKFEFNG